jgi:hypothetical protein
MINIVSISTNSISNTSKIVLEVFETKGSIEKQIDRLVITLPGRYDSVTEELRTLIDAELVKNGFTYNPISG